MFINRIRNKQAWMSRMINKQNGICLIPTSTTLATKTTIVLSLFLLLFSSHLFSDEVHVKANLIQVIDTSNYPSPDPSGIIYLPSENKFLIVDSEVNEMDIFPSTQANVFKIDDSGTLHDVYSTIPFSDEPTGITINPLNNHCFISDDTGRKSVYEINPGVDGICFTTDDIVTSFRTEDFGSTDPEDLTYVQGSLYIIDGLSHMVFAVNPGPNGKFDGVAADDQVTGFDARNLGLTDPESIYYDPTSDTLYLIDSGGELIYQSTKDGQLVRTIDVMAAHPRKPSALTIAPSSFDPATNSIFMTARGRDNDSDPDENDGMIYELEVPPFTLGNNPPIVSAGEDQSILMPDSTILDGSASDDGLPNNALTVGWSKVSGEGDVNFADAADLKTMVSFSSAGDYVLRLSASDGELQSYDDVTIHVAMANGIYSLSRQIDLSTNDAEENANGRVDTNSSDLELIYDGTDQLVGLRFTDIDIPQGATIISAYLQFQADEVKSTTTSLVIQAERSSNAATFVENYNNISSRPRTIAMTTWNPDPWLIVGEASTNQATPDIQPVIAEIIGQSGWDSGNSLAIIISGNGERVAEAYDGEPNGAPTLYIEYTYSEGNQPPLVYAGEDQSITLPDSVSLEGEVSDDGNPSNTLTTSWSKVSGEGNVIFSNPNDLLTTAAFSVPGDYVLRLTASDGELTSVDDIAIAVSPQGIQVLSRRIGSGIDDAEEKGDGRVDVKSSDLELVYDGSNQFVGLRFTDIDIPRDSNIIKAYIQFQADEVKSTTTALTIQGELSGSTESFVTENGNISSRPRTSSSVSWFPEPWLVVGEADINQQTTDISTVIAEIITQSEWSSGNSLSIIITGSGERVAESYNGDSLGAPLLYVEYIPLQ